MTNIIFIAVGFAVIALCLAASYFYGKKGSKPVSDENERLEKFTLSSTRNMEAQTVLAKLKYNKKPFEGAKTADFRIYNTFEGTELGVYINGIKIGDIPQDKKDDFTQKMHLITGIRDYSVIEDKKTKVLTCEIIVGFKK